MVWAVVALMLFTGTVVVKQAKETAKTEETRSSKHWSLDCRQQGHEPRIEMKNSVVVENWQGKGSCEEEPVQEQQIQK